MGGGHGYGTRGLRRDRTKAKPAGSDFALLRQAVLGGIVRRLKPPTLFAAISLMTERSPALSWWRDLKTTGEERAFYPRRSLHGRFAPACKKAAGSRIGSDGQVMVSSSWRQPESSQGRVPQDGPRSAETTHLKLSGSDWERWRGRRGSNPRPPT